VVALHSVTFDGEIDRIPGDARRANGRAPDPRVVSKMLRGGLVPERIQSVDRKNPRSA